MIDLEAERTRYVAALAYLGQATFDRVLEAMVTLEIEFAPRLKTMGGWYWPVGCDHPLRGILRTALIEINPAQTDEHQRVTLGHELAHRWDHELMNGRGHARSWRFWMRALKLPAEECHQYKELRGNARTYDVRCGSCGYAETLSYAPWRCPVAGCGEREMLKVRPAAISAAANKPR